MGVLGRSRIDIIGKLGMRNNVLPYIINNLFTNYVNWKCINKVVDVNAKGDFVIIVKFLA